MLLLMKFLSSQRILLLLLNAGRYHKHTATHVRMVLNTVCDFFLRRILHGC